MDIKNKIMGEAVWESLDDSSDITSLTLPNSHDMPLNMYTEAMSCCYNCSKQIPANSKFCPYCAVELYITCPKCGYNYSTQYPICNQCGTNYKDYMLNQSLMAESEKKRKKLKAQERQARKKAREANRPQVLEFDYIKFNDSIKIFWKTQNASSCNISMRRKYESTFGICIDENRDHDKLYNFPANGEAIVSLNQITEVANWLGVTTIEIYIEAVNDDWYHGDKKSLFFSAYCPKLGFAKTKVF